MERRGEKVIVYNKGYRQKICTVLILLTALLSGCAGPSTRVLPRQQAAIVQDVPESLPLLEAANPFYVREALDYVVSESREPGSPGEKHTEDYLSRMLDSYGYQVEVLNHRITAVREADAPDSDILIAYTSYGTGSRGMGTMESAAGTVVLLETARLLAASPTDTELRIVFLPEGPTAIGPVRSYLETLYPEEKARIIGAVQIGTQGNSEGEKLVLATSDGKPTLLAEQLNKSVMQLTGRTLDYIQRPVTGMNVFMRNEIPAVSLESDRRFRITGTYFDREDLADTDILAENADIISQALYAFMDPESPSMLAKSRYYNDIRDDAFPQLRDAVLPFGEPREKLEQMTGQAGTLVSENASSDGQFVEVFQYPMKWFDVDQVILTNYYYYNGLLQEAALEADSAGVDYEDILERIKSVYGESTQQSDTPYGISYSWTDKEKRLYLALEPENDTYEVTFREFDMPRTELDADSEEADRIRKLAAQVFPVEQEYIEIEVYTDGLGATCGDVNRIPSENEEEPDRFVIGIDQLDAISNDGTWRNKENTIWMMTGLYAELLEERDPERYFDPFPEPDAFAESFQWFLFEELPEDDANGLRDRMRYFYDFEELVSYREWFRKNMN